MIAIMNPYAWVPIAMVIWIAVAGLVTLGAITAAHLSERRAAKQKEHAR